MAEPRVDLVVGIDFGMTCTGRWESSVHRGYLLIMFKAVAFSNTRMPLPKVIQGWPGKPGESHNKVPSTISYAPAESFVTHWGFLCQHTDEKRMVQAVLESGKIAIDSRYETETDRSTRSSIVSRGSEVVQGLHGLSV